MLPLECGRARARAHALQKREQRTPTGSEEDSGKTKRTARERRDEERSWGRKENATDGGRARERERSGG